jgi:dihydroorotate dehydrogenase
MSAYALARPFLFSLDPETAHHVTLKLADWGMTGWPRAFSRPVRVMGLEFPNPVGLAAGLDKDAAHIDGLARLGFGFIEVGTVTPLPQSRQSASQFFELSKKIP